MRASLKDTAPAEPIQFVPRFSVVRVEFDLRASLNADAPDGSIEFQHIMSVVRVEFDLSK